MPASTDSSFPDSVTLRPTIWLRSRESRQQSVTWMESSGSVSMLLRVANEPDLSVPSRLSSAGYGRAGDSRAARSRGGQLSVPTRTGYRRWTRSCGRRTGVWFSRSRGSALPSLGTLRVPVNAPWTVGGRPADLYTSRSSTNPLDQLETNCYAVKNGIGAAGPDRLFVHGAVVVMPSSPAEIALARVGPRNPVGDVGDRVELRSGIHVVVVATHVCDSFSTVSGVRAGRLGGARRPWCRRSRRSACPTSRPWTNSCARDSPTTFCACPT
ncbi:hypothetical protein GS506_12275 [Rhodococcus hoagii]|nr:hypothetical protein [Prescottella equi]